VNTICEKSIAKKTTCCCVWVVGSIEESVSEVGVFIDILIALLVKPTGTVPTSILEPVDVCKGKCTETQEFVKE
jgi:hypothetical protein